ncbi:Peptidoglycan/LPS O-acetylase OafA/YrhL, contains acyltransferase and SGNH-hydrolase domains [Amycolatopsis marina]|uniref:Peptidoglycan/LPS O-acetylase OafA/YrhL, contains acyltransferase and SGNH-hydrolase domains n=1 Tax=Amycolatopsis marina TaxID=490629 RepID=A0A1I0XPS2_9PSEU|nr:acyltransferase family protein [Amycolatopsis marina]SFB02198.1 Peptidoglycan/LPS O-acetylase OafA/YrhL, contains acyltransferase and SGNH-hydrolase domains [Amycolatopsis marina]
MNLPSVSDITSPPINKTGPADSRKTPLVAGFRPEIEGLRAVAVLMVVVYHVWFGRVSGGVDVFLVLTGFLISGSLLRAAENRGRIEFGAFWGRLFKRLFPPVAVVLLGVLVATYLWLPENRWHNTIGEVVATAFYFENWSLATSAVDYLDRTELPSPVQHFWSLSMQGQFYVIWAVLISLVTLVFTRLRFSTRSAGLALFTSVFVASLTYSIFVTSTNQPWAYFDLGARLWEFALGGILAIALPYLRLPQRLRVLLGWLGLAALILCGALFDVSTLFPGYVALWPVIAALLVVIAGTTGSRIGADRLLTWRPLKYLGGISYALYLWHWPVLIVYLAVRERSLATFRGGLIVICVSLVLAAATKALLENPVNAFTKPRTSPAWAVAVVGLFMAPVLVASTMWTQRLDSRAELAAAMVDDPERYPGAQAIAFPERNRAPGALPVLPEPASARDDLPVTYEKGCHVTLEGTEVAVCEYGPGTADYSIAVVGASRSAHWYPALKKVVDNKGWTLFNLTKSSCQFSTDTPLTVNGELYEECVEWREGAMRTLSELRPDAVLTSSTHASPEEGEQTFQGFVDRWRQLDELGIKVAGIRDLPRVEIDGPECVATRGADQCVSSAAYSQADTDPARDLVDLPDNVALIDMTEYVCPAGECPAVIGNVLVYRDTSHLTATYSRTLAPILEEKLIQAIN